MLLAHLHSLFVAAAAVRSQVVIPEPIPGMITEAVLVESFEPGQGVSKYMKTPTQLNTQIVARGVDAYLKMLLQDNFVHTDLHPGNILVRAAEPVTSCRRRPQNHHTGMGSVSQQHAHRATIAAGAGGSAAASSSIMPEVSLTSAVATSTAATPAWELELMQQSAQQQQRWQHNHSSGVSSLPQQQLLEGELTGDPGRGTAQAQIVLLDFGLAEELTPVVRHHFISFLNSIVAGMSSVGVLATMHCQAVTKRCVQKLAACVVLVCVGLQMYAIMWGCSLCVSRISAHQGLRHAGDQHSLLLNRQIADMCLVLSIHCFL